MLTLLAALWLGTASDVTVTVEVKKPLKLSAKGKLSGTIVATVKNGGSAPARLYHRDVHGLRFQPVAGGAPAIVLHGCDCGFELKTDAPPPTRNFILQPGQERVLQFDQWSCDGGAFRVPAPGKYLVSWGLEPAPLGALLVESQKSPGDAARCEQVVRERTFPFVSAPVEAEISRAK